METRDNEHQPHIRLEPTSWLGALPQCQAVAPAALEATARHDNKALIIEGCFQLLKRFHHLAKSSSLFRNYTLSPIKRCRLYGT